LRSQGVDSEIDQYEEAPPEGWPKWMARQIQESDYVLVVCADLLFKRANDHSGDESGLGVKWEKKLILLKLYTVGRASVTVSFKVVGTLFSHYAA